MNKEQIAQKILKETEIAMKNIEGERFDFRENGIIHQAILNGKETSITGKYGTMYFNETNGKINGVWYQFFSTDEMFIEFDEEGNVTE